MIVKVLWKTEGNDQMWCYVVAKSNKAADIDGTKAVVIVESINKS